MYKLHRLETALEEIRHEKVWLKSGGFLVIQQTEAFVSIDVNSGKFTGRKKMQETYRKINLEAAGEIARQLQLRNLSGLILIDFINMENPDHQDELFHCLSAASAAGSCKSKGCGYHTSAYSGNDQKKGAQTCNRRAQGTAISRSLCFWFAII